MEPRLADLYRKAKTAAVADLAGWLDTRFREEIEADKWPFPTPPTVRDVVNTGRLRDSQEHTASPEGGVRFSWTAPYAGPVHEGGVSLTGVRFPGRPWTQAPIQEMPAKFAELLANRLGGGQR